MRRALCAVVLALVTLTPAQAIVVNPRVYTLVLGQQAFNPSDSTTYYFGANQVLGPSTVQSIAKIVPGHTGRITAAYVDTLNLTTQGTSENATLSLRLNATTDTTVTTVFQHDQAVGTPERFSANLNLVFDADDAIEAKIVTPAFATNPAGVYYVLTLVIEQAGR